MKIRVAMLDGDKTYVSRFFDCFNKYYFENIELYAFTNDDSLLEFLKCNKIDILLMHEDFCLNNNLEGNVIIIKLIEKISLENQSKTILKYQKISLIYKEILNEYSSVYKGQIKSTRTNSYNNTISFMSSGAGSGTSTIASAFAISLIKKNKKVLFIDMQSFPTINCVFEAEGKFTMSEIMYAIKSKKADLSLRIESALKVDNSGVNFYDPCKNPLERNEITAENLITLLEKLKEITNYDYIIIDIDFLLNETCLKLLNYSDSVVFVSNTTDENYLKLSSILKSIEILQLKNNENYIEKVNIIYNKYVNGRGMLIDKFDVNVILSSPFHNVSHFNQ